MRMLNEKWIKQACLSCFLCVLAMTATALGKEPEQQIRDTLRALPEALRSEATVIGYQNGERTVLRTSIGNIICWADDPERVDNRGAYFVNCFPKSVQAFEERRAELASASGWVEVLEKEVKSGEINVPAIAMRYTLRGASAEGAVPLGVLMVPFATAHTMGLSTEPDSFRPWLMMEGTVMAHVMLPGH